PNAAGAYTLPRRVPSPYSRRRVDGGRHAGARFARARNSFDDLPRDRSRRGAPRPVPLRRRDHRPLGLAARRPRRGPADPLRRHPFPRHHDLRPLRLPRRERAVDLPPARRQRGARQAGRLGRAAPAAARAAGELVAGFARIRAPARGRQGPAPRKLPRREPAPLSPPAGRPAAAGRPALRGLRRRGPRARAEIGDLPGAPAVFLNVQPRSLTNPEFTSRLIDAMLSVGLDHRRVILELTEQHTIVNPRAFAATLVSLRDLGLRIALDDFGEGSSNLNLFLDLRPEILKISASFCRGVDSDPFKQALVKSTAEMAARTGAITVMEAVETEAEAAEIERLGIDYGQGYFFSEPKRGWELAASDRLRHGPAA